MSDIELRVHRCMVHVVLDKLLWALWAIYAVSADGNAVCATAFLGVLAHVGLHGRRGGGGITRVGR